jgi:hypothetical protein
MTVGVNNVMTRDIQLSADELQPHGLRRRAGDPLELLGSMVPR